MLSALDIDASDEETAALFRYLDVDGSGGVSFEQFEPWYSEAADAAKQSAEVFQGIIMSRRTVDSFDKTEVDQAVIKRAIECAIAAPVSTSGSTTCLHFDERELTCLVSFLLLASYLGCFLCMHYVSTYTYTIPVSTAIFCIYRHIDN